MANTVEAFGTQLAVVTTEHTLHTSALAVNFVLMVNTENMVNGDRLILRVKTKVISTSTIRVAYKAHFANVQAQNVKVSIPLPATGQTSGSEFTLQQTAGTGRNFEWSVISIG
jgi:hypothetical protein